MIKDIMRMSAKHYGVSLEELVSPMRRRAYSKPRWAIHMALHRRKRKHCEIGRWMNRNHATIIYGIRQAEYWIERDPEFRDLIDRMASFAPVPLTQEIIESLTQSKESDNGYLDCD